MDLGGLSCATATPPMTCRPLFLILEVQTIERRSPSMSTANAPHRARIILTALLVLFGAYWVGARFGPHQPINVGAVPSGSAPAASGPNDTPAHLTNAQRDAVLTDDPINVRVYRQASPAVANILTKATQYDFFMDAVPVEGAGSGFVIDPRG